MTCFSLCNSFQTSFCIFLVYQLWQSPCNYIVVHINLSCHVRQTTTFAFLTSHVSRQIAYPFIYLSGQYGYNYSEILFFTKSMVDISKKSYADGKIYFL